MKESQLTPFETWVKKAELQAKNNPGLYKFKLGLFAVLGYLVIFSVLSLLIVLIGGTIGIAFVSSTIFLLLIKKKLIILIAISIWVLLKALWIRFEAPQGYELTRRDFPYLFNEIDNLQKQLDAPTIHNVILTNELNAAISQTPRLGVLGWQKNTLILGLELLLVLSQEQARAVLAHEFGHLSGNHSRFNGWIYRIRMTWHRVMEAFDESESFGARLLKRFFDWYSPKFAAYSFVLARSNEYEADKISAELTTVDVARSALVNTYVTAPFVNEEYWQHFYKKADELPGPEYAPYYGLASFLADNRQSDSDVSLRIEKEMEIETSYDNTHPALKDRLSALGMKAEVPAIVTDSAALIWLGELYEKVIEDFDKQWLSEFSDSWEERFNYVKEARQRLAKLEAKDKFELTEEELWDIATLNEEFNSANVALPLYRVFQSRYPENTRAAFAIGRLLYDQDDVACLEQFEKAVSDPYIALDVCEYAYYFCLSHEMEKDDENR